MRFGITASLLTLTLTFNHMADFVPIDPYNPLKALAARVALERKTTDQFGKQSAAALASGMQGSYGSGNIPAAPGKSKNVPQVVNVKGNSQLQKFLNAISTQESHGRYNALGVVTRSGDRAYGKYQIMGNNIPKWSKAALGRSVTPQEFLKSPQIQEKVAQYVLSSYFNRYGAAGAAKAWYAGPGNAYTNSNAPQYGGPSINAYAAQVLARMGIT